MRYQYRRKANGEWLGWTDQPALATWLEDALGEPSDDARVTVRFAGGNKIQWRVK